MVSRRMEVGPRWSSGQELARRRLKNSSSNAEFSLRTRGTPSAVSQGIQQYLVALNRLESSLANAFLGDAWFDQLHSQAFYSIRSQPAGVERPLQLLEAEIGRVIRWLKDLESELDRISDQDEFEGSTGVRRLVFDASRDPS